MADKITVPQYPTMFDSSQFNNQYSPYGGSALPPTSYVGAPTDARGNPIAGYQAPQPVFTPGQVPGMTLNSQPQMSYQMLTPGGQYTGGANNSGMAGQNAPATYGMAPSFNRAAQEAFKTGDNAYLSRMGFGPGGFQGALSGGGGGSWSTPNNSAAYLSALANPGHVTTPGMPVQSTGYQANNGVLDTILAQLRATGGQGQAAPPGVGGGSAGLSTGTNTGFLNALGALRSGAAPTAGAGTGTA